VREKKEKINGRKTIRRRKIRWRIGGRECKNKNVSDRRKGRENK
jgi:hypothetical protein